MPWLRHAAAIFILIAVAWPWVGRELDSSPYSYDESDYMYAVSRGWAANWADTPALNLVEFIRIGLTRGRDHTQRTQLSEMIRNSGDMDSYRHWHGPAYYDWLGLAPSGQSEYGMRMWSLACPLLLLLIGYFGCLWVFPGREGMLAAILAGVLLAWNAAAIRTTELAPHLLFAAFAIASLVFAAKMMATGERRYWYGALVFTGLTFCTMELSFALILAVWLCGYWERKRLRFDWVLLRNSIAAFVAPVVVLWPAGLYKLAFIKSYLAMAYLAVFRKGAWGNVTFGETWAIRLGSQPLAWILIVLAVVLLMRYQWMRMRREVLPFLLFGVLMLLAVLRVNAPGLRYVIPFLPALLVFAACVLAIRIARFRPAVQAVIVGGIAIAAWADTAREIHPVEPNHRTIDLLAAIRQNHWENRPLVVPGEDVPMLHYYFPHAQLRPYLDTTEANAQQADGAAAAMIYPGYPVRVETITR